MSRYLGAQAAGRQAATQPVNLAGINVAVGWRALVGGVGRATASVRTTATATVR